MADHHLGISIISISGHNRFSLNETALKRLVLQENVKDLPVAVISVGGAFRKGKSFLLDFFLRYANNRYGREESGRGNWLGNEDEPLTGFPWSGGSTRNTTGILIWSNLFVCSTSNHGNICVMLMDTQGTFDSDSSVREWATVFAISTMISSVQIYNVSQNIQEDDLQHLELFVEYGRLAQSKTHLKPFQKLVFLVRDWSYPYEAEFGAAGGKQFLNKRLKIREDQHQELQNIRRNITSCFDQIECFLMPHPGLKVARDPSFNGSLSEMDQIFRAKLEEFVTLTMASENLIPKRINGEIVTTKELLTYLKAYITIFNSDELPEPKSIFMATAEANNLSAAAEALETYNKSMNAVCGGRVYVSTTVVTALHHRSKESAIQRFVSKPKIGSSSYSDVFKVKLERDIDKSYKHIRTMNEHKNIFSILQFPAKLIALVILCEIFSNALAFLGFKTLARYVSWLSKMSILLIITWFYYQYQNW